MLAFIFTDINSVMIGFGFSSDIAMFKKFVPQLTSIQNIPRFIDVMEFYKQVYPAYRNTGGASLANVCERVMAKKLCKKE